MIYVKTNFCLFVCCVIYKYKKKYNCFPRMRLLVTIGFIGTIIHRVRFPTNRHRRTKRAINTGIIGKCHDDAKFHDCRIYTIINIKYIIITYSSPH